MELKPEDIKFFPVGMHTERKDMPQVPSKHLDEFFQYLEDKGIRVDRNQKVDPNKLTASQKEYDPNKIIKMIEDKRSKPSIVANGGYIVDGHHGAAAALNDNRHVDAHVIGADIQDVLHHAHSFMKTKNSEINEELTRKDFEPMLKNFISFAKENVGVKELPKIRYKDINDDFASFGGYSPQTNELIIQTRNRHPMDIFRTVVHELVHRKQDEDGRLNDPAKEGETGSEIENQANAEAAVHMRNYAKKNPHLFDSGYVVEEYLTEAIKKPNRASYKATIVTGPPGAGKSGLAKNIVKPHGEIVEIDSDHFFEHILRKKGMSLTMPPEQAMERNMLRDVAKRLSQRRLDSHISKGGGLIINTTGHDFNKIKKVKDHLEKIGYDVSGFHVHVDDDVSRERNIQRGKEGGRTVPEDVRGKYWKKINDNVPKFKELFGDKFRMMDNNLDKRQATKEQLEKRVKKEGTHYKWFNKFFTSLPKNPMGRQKVIERIGQERAERVEAKTNRPTTRKPKPINEDLRQWFKEKWVRFDTKGKIKGECARGEGEGKPKCLPLAKAQAMSKEERAVSARRKREEDPNPKRKGKAKFVATEEYLMEKNVPTNPELWSRAKAEAKRKFKIYPSAYANAFAAKKYKKQGGGWKKKDVNEQFETWSSDPYKREWGTTELARMYMNATPGQECDTPKKLKVRKKKIYQEYGGTTTTAYDARALPLNNYIGPQFSNQYVPSLGGGSWGGGLAEGFGLGYNDMGTVPSSNRYKDDDALYTEDGKSPAWQRKEGKSPTGGLNKKGVESYRRENPGSKLQTAVTTKPSKLKKGSKSWKRRKSFCSRMSGMPGPMKDEKGRPTRKALSLRKWNCE